MIGSAVASAFFAGTVAILATVAIERFGGALGGVLGSAPTTIVPASIGFWLGSGGVQEFQESLFAVPVGMCVNAVFLYSWRICPKHLAIHNLKYKLLCMTLLSICIWSLCAFGMVLGVTYVEAYLFETAVSAIGGLLLFGVWACTQNPPSPKGTQKVSPVVLFLRGLLASVAIGISIYLATIGDSVLAGMASVFPAIFLTTMCSVWLAQGEAVQAGAVGPMMLGSSSVSIYALIAAFLFPEYDWTTGAVLSWCSAVLFVSIPAWFWLKER